MVNVGLSPDEKKTLEALTKKAKEPDGPPISGVTANITMSVEEALKFGFLTEKEAEAAENGSEGEGEGEGDKPPRRGGYFGDK